ncbi:hypothetical protein NA57DRAFT_30963 [Rhizodiscina lignyota]|uniref:BSD domain-containing protein n=1 Tax=Rhizodiscina lignyota TaxID=1504668 RepID=A0A9P4IM82_9PEZI|nr:hypothetical protein NA57DRAFT_30963 [Rhizodiscina lignyota]
MSTTSTRASTSYKKQDGILALAKDRKTVVWTPAAPPNAPPALTLLVQNISNLQQTGAASAKVSIKVFVQRPGAPTPDTYVFNFTSPKDARAEQVAITDELKIAIEDGKKQNEEMQVHVETPGPAGDAESGSAAMVFAKAVSGASNKDEDAMLEDSKLIADNKLQRSLLEANPSLRQRFNESLKEKPESITMSQFSMQFWSTRVHLLRAHAVEKSQSQGAYNVLSEVKPKNVDGTIVLNLSKEQIQIIFKQHPVLRRVYNEVVPRLNESDFWARFFQSKLFKTLKGEKITEIDHSDPVLDKFLNFDEDAERGRQLTLAHIPHFIDLEGNEQNHSQRKGNAPDWTMRPTAHDKVPILRALNDMSEKMMADVQPSDAEAHAPAGMDEDTFNELQLRDLQRQSEDNRIMLRIKDQAHFLAGDGTNTNGMSDEAALFAKQSPTKVLSVLQQDLKSNFLGPDGGYGVNLEAAIGVHDDSSSDSDSDSGKKKRRATRVGSKAARAAATTHVMQLIRTRREQTSTSDFSSFDAPTGTFAPLSSAAAASETGLSTHVLDQLSMTHNTTIEFLHYFWVVFLSGDADRARELATLAQTLEKSITRIDAVGDAAEKEREERVEKLRRHAEEVEKRTGRKRRVDISSVRGGKAEVMRVAGPTLNAIKDSVERYKAELEKQTQAAQRLSSGAIS